MSQKFHVPDEPPYRVLKCMADSGSCKYNKHFDTIDEAWEAFEQDNQDKLFPTDNIASNLMLDAWERTQIKEEKDPIWNPRGEELKSRAESAVLRNLQELEGEIERHRELKRGGGKPEEFWSFNEPIHSKRFIDVVALSKAWKESDYDEVRLLYAIGMSRDKDRIEPGSIRLAPGQLVKIARESYRIGEKW